MKIIGYIIIKLRNKVRKLQVLKYRVDKIDKNYSLYPGERE